MFGKAKCKLCGDTVRLALKHLNDKHAEVYSKEAKNLKIPDIMSRYFVVD